MFDTRFGKILRTHKHAACDFDKVCKHAENFFFWFAFSAAVVAVTAVFFLALTGEI